MLAAGEPFFRVEWILANLDEIGSRLVQHVLITALAVSIGFALSFPIALIVRRSRRMTAATLAVTGILYAIPSLALFGLLIPITGLSLLTAEIAMVSYTLLILVRNTIAGLEAVAPEVIDAAEGMGYTARQRLWRVELPIATPVIVAGIRIATVTTIGLVTVTSFIGMGGLGYLILTVGINRYFPTAIYVGVLLSVVLAVIADLLLLGLERRLTPWSRTAGAAG